MTIMGSVTAPFKAGATPNTFDGAAKVTVHSNARELVGLIMSHSLSIYTTNEGGGLIVRLKSSSLSEQFFMYPVVFHSGPATNSALYGMPATILPLAITTAGSETYTIDITSFGGTQTGTLDTCIGLMYRDHQAIPSDIRHAMPNCVAAKGGVWEYDAVAATTRQVLDGHGGASLGGVMTIPSAAREIIGMLINVAKDGAVTATENVDGYIDLWSDFEIGQQEYPFPPCIPGLGTEVEGGAPSISHYIPMHIGPLPSSSIRMKAYANLHEAVTASVQVAVNLLWR